MRQIPDHYNYMATDEGEIYSLLTHKVMRPSLSNNGYKRIVVRVNGDSVSRLVHRLVAMAYISNDEGLPQVNHKDGDKTNNRPTNLEWTDSSGNMQHAYNTLKVKLKPIELVKDGVGYWYPSHISCCKDTGLPHGSVSALYRGTRNVAQGYRNDTHFHEGE